MKKFELTNETLVTIEGVTLYRIRALKDFADVKAGDLGGWVEKEINLNQDGNCWVYDDAMVYTLGRVSGNAQVRGWACVYNSAIVYGNAVIACNASVYDSAMVCGEAVVTASAQITAFSFIDCGIVDGVQAINNNVSFDAQEPAQEVYKDAKELTTVNNATPQTQNNMEKKDEQTTGSRLCNGGTNHNSWRNAIARAAVFAFHGWGKRGNRRDYLDCGR